MEGSQPEKDTTKMQYIKSGVASEVDSDGGRLTRGSGLRLVNKACSVVPVFFPFRARVFYTGGSGCVRITQIEPQPFLFYGDEDIFTPEWKAVWCRGLTDGSHIGDGSQHGAEATSRDRWCDFRLRGGVRVLNDAHEFSVSIVAIRNGPTGEQEEQDKDI
uniref:Uncharacterized protein n=1 Tax=Mesocestoides corti TaxID=53468 RepID=A0A5K3ELN8_MESCO